MNTIIGLILLGFTIWLALALANAAIGLFFLVVASIYHAFIWVGKSIAKVWRSLE